jgi:hypothetical protein
MFMDAPMVAACLDGIGVGVGLGAGSGFAAGNGVVLRFASPCGSSVRLFHILGFFSLQAAMFVWKT